MERSYFDLERNDLERNAHGTKQPDTEKDIQYIVAPFEADAELAYLSTSGHEDAVLTEDSGLLAYGCKKVPVS